MQIFEIITYFVERLNERSTWIGIITIVSGLGYGLAPQQADTIIHLGTTAAGLVLTLTKDKIKETENAERKILPRSSEGAGREGEAASRENQGKNQAND